MGEKRNILLSSISIVYMQPICGYKIEVTEIELPLALEVLDTQAKMAKLGDEVSYDSSVFQNYMDRLTL